MQQMTLHHKTTHGWYCKVREEKKPILTICLCTSAALKPQFLFHQVRTWLGVWVVKSPELHHMEVKGHLITSMGLGAPGESQRLLTSHDTHFHVQASLKRSVKPISLFFFRQFNRRKAKVFFSREGPAEKTVVCVKAFCSHTVTTAVR